MNSSHTIEIPILTYHSIDEGGSIISISAKTFRRQMKFLSENGFNVISLKSLEKKIFENEIILPKTVVLTFDDGFENFYTSAFPILKDYNFSATVFLITDYCGKMSNWSGNSPLLKPFKLMDWSQITELNNYHIEFASHTKTHPDLTKLSSLEIKRELFESKRMIEERLGTEVTGLAYPYGKFDILVKQIAAENFKIAFSTNLGKANLNSDFFAMRRLDVYFLKNEYLFNSILSGKFNWYINTRQVMRTIKSKLYNN